jgi:hypothetical protein
MLRIIKEYRYVLYVFDPKKGGQLLHYKLDYFKAGRFHGMFRTNLGLNDIDMVVFVFRRNQGVFLKFFNL